MVVERVGSARGMVLISRSEARGRVFIRRGCCGMGIGVGGEGAAGEDWRTCFAFSSQAARAAGSMGQAAGRSSRGLAMAVWAL